MRVLGFDPGYGITGWGVVENRVSPRVLDYGILKTSHSDPMHIRLAEILRNALEIIDRFSPERVAIERIYFGNLKTTGEGVLEARGVLLAAAGQTGVPVVSFAPSVIKNAITGSGRAGKAQVVDMVMRILAIREKIKPDDAADALAVALATLFAGDMVDQVSGLDA